MEDGSVPGDLRGGEMMSKEKMQKFIYIVGVPVEQAKIDALGFGEWLKIKREELVERFGAKSVTISVFGRAIYVIGVEKSTAMVDNMGFRTFCYSARKQLMETFNTMQAFVVAV